MILYPLPWPYPLTLYSYLFFVYMITTLDLFQSFYHSAQENYRIMINFFNQS